MKASHLSCSLCLMLNIYEQDKKINRIYDGVEAETRKSQASFQIIQVSSEALLRMRPE